MSFDKYGMSKGTGVPKAKHFGFNGFGEKLKADLNEPEVKTRKYRGQNKPRPPAPIKLSVLVEQAIKETKKLAEKKLDVERDLDREAETARVRYQARLLAGLCPRCGFALDQDTADAGGVLCVTCCTKMAVRNKDSKVDKEYVTTRDGRILSKTQYARMRSAERSRLLKANGCCTYCALPIDANDQNFSLCEICREKQKSRFARQRSIGLKYSHEFYADIDLVAKHKGVSITRFCTDIVANLVKDEVVKLRGERL